jgi:hypothetical protein
VTKSQRIRWEEEKCLEFVGKLEGRRLFGRPRSWWWINIIK